MNISIFGKHWGLVSTLRDILEPKHNVSVVEANSFPKQFALREEKTKPDVHISTFPYDDIKHYDRKTPLILYATDPVYNFIFEEVKEIQKWEGCLTVAAEPCFEQTYWPITPEMQIEFAIDTSKYFLWTGGINRVAVVNRKARERWTECVRGATGIAYTLEDFLGDVPFDVLQIDDNTEYRKALSQYDAAFYYSNSPYTLVMWEEMSLGIPTVGFNHHQTSTYKPIEKYLHHYSTDIDEVRRLLKMKLAKPEKETYPIPSLDTIRDKWDLAISTAHDRGKELFS